MNLPFLFACLVLTGQPAAPERASPAQPDAAAPTAQESPFQKKLKEIDQRLGKLTQLRAEFEQRKSTALLKKPMVSSGTVLVKGGRVRWDTRSPRPSTLVSGGREVQIYYPEAGVLEIHRPPADLLDLSATPLPRLIALSKRFELKEIDAALMGAPMGDKRYVAVELTPRDADLKKHVASVRVLLDEDVPCVKRLTLVDPDDETTEIDFKDVRVDVEIRDEQLELRVPEGTRVVRLADPGAKPESKAPGKEEDIDKPGTPRK